MASKGVDPDGVRLRGFGFGFPRSMIQSLGPPVSPLCFPVARGERASSSASELISECQLVEGSLPSSRFFSRLPLILDDNFGALAASESLSWPRSRPSTPEVTFEPLAAEANVILVRIFL